MNKLLIVAITLLPFAIVHAENASQVTDKATVQETTKIPSENTSSMPSVSQPEKNTKDAEKSGGVDKTATKNDNKKSRVKMGKAGGKGG